MRTAATKDFFHLLPPTVQTAHQRANKLCQHPQGRAALAAMQLLLKIARDLTPEDAELFGDVLQAAYHKPRMVESFLNDQSYLP